MKNLVLTIILLSVLVGCSTKVIDIELEEDFGQRLGIYGQVYKLSSINSEFIKNNLRYKMLIIDSRSWNKNKKEILATRKTLKIFGESLGKKAIVLNLILKTSKKRDFFRNIQNRLGRYFNPDKDAPFLIFYKPNPISGKYIPYEIISLASISPSYLNKKLTILSKAINPGKIKKEILTH